MEFKQVLNKHLTAMVSKNLSDFVETVSKDNITLIMPNGKLITSFKEFFELHDAWFSDEDWSIEYEIMNIVEKTELSTALLKINYKDIDEKDEIVYLNYYLNLMFEYIDDSWLLVHDQNTIFTESY